ncbi:MAG: tRNA adenosine(34) deaminase TadA [Firmicutes bacterium]|nr:tRNA adenosine(34) deaminase TadA [Bacillota bacterium]
MWSGDDLYFMKLALEAAEQADREDEVPIGAVLVLEGKRVGRGHNCPIGRHDPSAHAEIMALRDACDWLKNYRVPGATLYVTLEPCLMCFGALTHARVERVVFGAADPKVGVSRNRELIEQARLNHHVTLEGGLLETECREMLQQFFQRRR